MSAASAAAFLCGLLFSAGLLLGGMTQPAKVVGFLDITGNWDPSLAFVMGGALGVHAILSRLIARRSRPVLAGGFSLPSRQDLDARLFGGAALFGIGWGLAGFCPGPAVVALGGGMPAAVPVVAAMLAGMLVHDRLLAGTRTRRP